ncbi:MAG: nucleotidyl transferase AbiEii/AbiGii toxin family protein [Candidatus Omnitrophota bacterium]
MISIDKIKKKAEQEGVSVNFVFKEYLHFLVLEYLFEKGCFSNLVFQGGTALRFVYKGVRYSEDLDFVLKEKDSHFLGGLFEGCLKQLPTYIDKFIPFAKDVQLKIQKDTLTFKRFNLILELEGFKAKDKTNIEFVNVPSYENQVVILEREDIAINPAITVETPQEILSDKFVALAARRYLKGRDIWDIYFILKTLKTPLDDKTKRMAVRKIADYSMNLKEFFLGFNNNLSLLEKEGYEILKEEMDKFLPSAYRAMFKTKYKEIVSFVWEVSTNLLKEIKK